MMLGANNTCVKVALFLSWVLSLGNRSLYRMCFFIGTTIATCEVYSIFIVYARTFAQYLGEYILEPTKKGSSGKSDVSVDVNVMGLELGQGLRPPFPTAEPFPLM